MAQVFDADDIDFDYWLRETDAQEKIRSVGVFAEEVVDYFWAEKGQVGGHLPWSKTQENIRFRPGEITLWGGMNGHGKSLAIGQMCLGLLSQGHHVCIASFEMRPVVTLARICRQAFGTSKPDPDDIREFHAVTDSGLYVYDQLGSVKPDQVLAVTRYCAEKLKIDHIVIDSLMKCGVPEDGPSAFNAQKEFIDKLCATAKDTGIHIHLVAHSRKQRDELALPGKMDVKGSGSITDQVDNIITVWRNKAKEKEFAEKGVAPNDPDCLLICDKQRNGEWEGRVGLWFIPSALQFVENSSGQTMQMLPGVGA